MPGRIPQRFIDELLARIDIVDLIDARVPLKKRGKEHMACCPFHTEKTPSFTVNSDKQFYHCFGCGAHGTALGFLMEYDHLEFVEAVESLAHTLGLEVEREGGAVVVERHDDLYEWLERAACFYRAQLKQSKAAVDYLKSRGLTGEISAEYGLGYAPAGWDALVRHMGSSASREALLNAGLVSHKEDKFYDRFRERIMFPIHDRRGRVIGFGGRTLGDGTPKYLNSPETPLFHKGRSLYGLYEARKATGKMERIVVVEGYMDVIALAQFGLRNVVATLGTATTRDHLLQLFRHTRELVFCFDGDRAGREAAWRGLQQLLPVFRDGWEARFLFLPEGMDPDDMSREHGDTAFLDQVEDAASLSDFLFDHLQQEVGLSGATGKARLAELGKPLLNQLPEGVFKEVLYQQLGTLIGLPADKLKAPQPRPGSKPSPRRQKGISPVRAAIRLLLHNPGFHTLAPSVSELEGVSQPGIPLLMKLLETLQSDPHLTPAGIVERFRDSENHDHLLQLMAWRPPRPDLDLLETEFKDVMARLSGLNDERRTEALLRKARADGLDATEKKELQALLSDSA
ncbi:MAG: DNA primase [Gammaproteobacteria bacterium]